MQLVLFPKLAQMQDDPGRLKDAYLRTLRLVTWAMALVNVTLLVVAQAFLVTWLGGGTARWLPACSALQILCVYGIIRASVETAVNPVLALGHSNILLRAQVLAAGAELVFMPFVAWWFGIEGVAVLVTAAYALQYAVYYPFLRARLGLRATDLAGVYLPIAAAGLVSAGLAFWLTGEGSGDVIQFGVRLVVVSAAFVLAHELLTRGLVYSECRAIVAAVMPPRGHRR